MANPTQRERMAAVFEGRRPEAVPWTADLAYWQAGRAALGTLPQRYAGPEGLRRLHHDTGTGRTFYVRSPVAVERDPALFRYEEADQGTTVRCTWVTPEGSLSGRFHRVGSSLAPIEYPLKTASDLPVMLAWYEGARYYPCYERFRESDREFGDDGYPIVNTERTPLAEFVVGWAGVTNFSYLAVDAPRELERAFERLRLAQLPMWELLAAGPGLPIEISDNLSAAVQASHFRRYSFDYYQHLAGLLRTNGKPLGVHIDGTLRGLLEQLPRAGLAFVESVTPAPVGDMTCAEARAAVGPDCIVIGGMPGAMFAPPWDWPQVRAHVREAVSALGAEGRFILGSADQVPPDGDIELARLIGEEVLSL